MHTTHTDIARTVHAALPPTKLVCASAGALGLTLDDLPSRSDVSVRLDLSPGSMTILTGPSGSGKSTLRTDLHRAFAESRWPERSALVDPSAMRPRDRPVVDLLAGRSENTDAALAWLARTGRSYACARTAERSPRTRRHRG